MPCFLATTQPIRYVLGSWAGGEMTRPVLLSSESALEFFRDALMEALWDERVTVGPFTQWYVVNLLVKQVHEGIHPGDTLTDRFVRALSAARVEKVRLLREVGDTALVTCGLWADRELRPQHPMDPAFHADMGRMAYARLSGLHHNSVNVKVPDVFAELADQFSGLVCALIRLGTKHSLSTARDIVRLFEKWQTTHSRHAARALAELGIMVGGDTGGKAPS